MALSIGSSSALAGAATVAAIDTALQAQVSAAESTNMEALLGSLGVGTNFSSAA
jgi:hypothetical protein